MKNCIFCQIVKGEIPAYKVWEDENFLAFLSIQPIKPGHTLVIPKTHENYLFDIDDTKIAHYMVACKKVAKILKKAFQPKMERIGMIVFGIDVPHTHIHLAPLDNRGDLNLGNAKSSSQQELHQALEKITAALKE